MGTAALGCPAATVFVAAAHFVGPSSARSSRSATESHVELDLRNSLQRFDRPGRTPGQIQNRAPSRARRKPLG